MYEIQSSLSAASEPNKLALSAGMIFRGRTVTWHGEKIKQLLIPSGSGNIMGQTGTDNGLSLVYRA